MRITGIAWHGFRIPFRRMYVTSGGMAADRHGLLLFLMDDSGRIGLGEASPIGAGSAGEVVGIAAALESLAPALLGAEVHLGGAGEWETPNILRFGLETALADLQGKRAAQSAAAVLGLTPHPLPVNALITAEAPADAARQAQAAVGQGFRTLKLKAAFGTAEQDEALVAAVREAAGPATRLRIDANQGWFVEEAITALRRIARYDLEYAEQPVAAADIAGLATVRRETAIPMAADEAITSTASLQAVLAADAADVIIIKPARAGGLLATLELMRICTEAGKPVVITTSLESGVGTAAAWQLAAALPDLPLAQGLSTGLLLESDLALKPVVPVQGMALPLPDDGLGVALDLEALRRYNTGIMGSAGSWDAALLGRRFSGSP